MRPCRYCSAVRVWEMHGTKYVRLPVFSLLVIFRSDSRDETAQFQLPATCQMSSIIGFQSSRLGAWYVLSLRLNVIRFCWGMKQDAGLRPAAEIIMRLLSNKPLHISVYVRLSLYLRLALRDLRLGWTHLWESVVDMGDLENSYNNYRRKPPGKSQFERTKLRLK